MRRRGWNDITIRETRIEGVLFLDGIYLRREGIFVACVVGALSIIEFIKFFVLMFKTRIFA